MHGLCSHDIEIYGKVLRVDEWMVGRLGSWRVGLLYGKGNGCMEGTMGGRDDAIG